MANLEELMKELNPAQLRGNCQFNIAILATDSGLIHWQLCSIRLRFPSRYSLDLEVERQRF